VSKAGYEARVRAWGKETADRFEYGIRAVPKVAAAPIMRGAPKQRRRRRVSSGRSTVRKVTRSARGTLNLFLHGRR
jgi:hypothetical protein